VNRLAEAITESEPKAAGAGARFVNVGERTNVTGSRAFARLVLAGNYAEALTVARQQVDSERFTQAVRNAGDDRDTHRISLCLTT